MTHALDSFSRSFALAFGNNTAARVAPIFNRRKVRTGQATGRLSQKHGFCYPERANHGAGPVKTRRSPMLSRGFSERPGGHKQCAGH